MAYTKATVITDVKTELGNSSYPDAPLNKFVKDVNRRIINKRRWKFMEETIEFTLSQGADEYELDSDIQLIYSLEILSPAGKRKDITDYFMDVRNFITYDARNTDSESSPRDFTYEKNILKFRLPADQSYTLKIHYYKKPSALDNATDIPDVPEEFQEILTLGVTAKALRRDDYYDESLVVERQAEDLELDMLLKYSPRQIGTPMIMQSNKGPARHRSRGRHLDGEA